MRRTGEMEKEIQKEMKMHRSIQRNTTKDKKIDSDLDKKFIMEQSVILNRGQIDIQLAMKAKKSENKKKSKKCCRLINKN